MKLLTYILSLLLIVNPVFATFNTIAAGDPILASKAMQNWRHVNYGNALIPVDSSGSGVDSTIDLGSSTYYFDDGFIDDLKISNHLYVSGKVGIGTASPSALLEIKSSSSAEANLYLNTGTNNDSGIRFQQQGTDRFIIGYDDSESGLRIYDFSGTPGTRFFVAEGGNVGIGVTDPDTRLEIFNAGNQLKLSYDGTDNTTFATDTNGDLTITPSGDEIYGPVYRYTATQNITVHKFTYPLQADVDATDSWILIDPHASGDGSQVTDTDGSQDVAKIMVILPDNLVIQGWSITIQDVNDASGAISVRMFKDTFAGSATALGALQTSAHDGSVQTLTDSFTETIDNGTNVYYFYIYSGTANGNYKFLGGYVQVK